MGMSEDAERSLLYIEVSRGFWGWVLTWLLTLVLPLLMIQRVGLEFSPFIHCSEGHCKGVCFFQWIYFFEVKNQTTNCFGKRLWSAWIFLQIVLTLLIYLVFSWLESQLASFPTRSNPWVFIFSVIMFDRMFREVRSLFVMYSSPASECSKTWSRSLKPFWAKGFFLTTSQSSPIQLLNPRSFKQLISIASNQSHTAHLRCKVSHWVRPHT